MKITHKIEQSGDGWMTVDELFKLADSLVQAAPPDAVVNVQSFDSQREPRSWRAVVGWEEEI